MEGASPVLDPVSNEILFIGGRTGNHPRGFIGHWAFSLKDKTWRKLEQKNALLEPVRRKVLSAIPPARDAMAAARNFYYSAQRDPALRQRPAELLARAVVSHYTVIETEQVGVEKVYRMIKEGKMPWLTAY